MLNNNSSQQDNCFYADNNQYKAETLLVENSEDQTE